MNTRRYTTRITTGLALAFALAAGSSVQAVAQEPSEFDTPEVRAFYTEYGVDQATQDRLIEGMENGDLIDALSEGAEPVSVEERIDDAKTETIYRYEDGSVGVTSLETAAPLPPGTVVPFAISGCTTWSGPGWMSAQNCLVSHTAAYASLSFRANYERTTAAGKITSYHSESVNTTIGSVQNVSLNLIRGTSNSSQPAVATLHGYWTGPGVSEDLYLSLRVSASTAWTTTY